MPPGPYAEETENQFDYEDDWKEVAEDNERGSAHFADTAQEDTLFGYVPWEKRRAAIRFFKGFAYTDETNKVLKREQPHSHPDYPWLRAYDVSVGGLILESNDENENGEPYDRSPFGINPETADRRTRYDKCLIAVKYRAFGDMWFLTDEELEEFDEGAEWYRNTLFLPPEPSVEALTVSGGLSQLTFSEGGGAPAPTAGSTKFGAPLPELQTKVGFRLLWQHVPWEFLSENNVIFWPQKIIDCIGRVNSDLFLEEFEPETIRMTTPTFEEFPWWVASDDVVEPLIGVNLYLNFEWFDPETGIDPPYARGWNNMPWSGTGQGADGGGDGKYYRATRNGTNEGRGILEAVPFSGMFTHWNAT